MRSSLILIYFFLFFGPTFCQVTGQYVITFKDKKNNTFSLDKPQEFLSERAINRRNKQGISIDESDLPISKMYLEELKSISSVSIVSKSKWFNDVVIELSDTSLLDKIASETHILSVKRIPGSFDKAGNMREKVLDTATIAYDGSYMNGEYGPAWRQVSMLNADFLHSQGYRGEGMRIAVIDGGFSWVWSSKHFEHLFKEGRIIDTYDFVKRNKEVYENSIHGNYVLSTMAAYTPGFMIGTAPFAEYLLLRSEDGSREYLLEEYFWTEAAEFADSAGVDLMNTSLGYTLFDDSLQDHTIQDLDGKTARMTLSSLKAFNKGILIFNSAGNSGTNSWQKIGVPADADLVLSVGAVDSSSVLASFSSRGPTADGRIKPDLMAMGKEVFVGVIDGTATKSNGTSFSSPVLTGAAACLWQANPDKSWKEIREALLKSADRYANPDTNYGYGLPDLILADGLLKGRNNQNKVGNASIQSFPNPCEDEFYILLKLDRTETVSLEIINNLGQTVGSYQKTISGGSSSYIQLKNEISRLQAGQYIIKLNSKSLNKDLLIIRK